MVPLRRPTKEELSDLVNFVEFNSEEQKYMNKIKKKRKPLSDAKDYNRLLKFYIDELKNIEGEFGDRIAVKRRLYYSIGHTLESMATFGMKNEHPITKAQAFENAITWYQAADELCGFLTDYALRQAECCTGAMDYRLKAGLNDKITEGFAVKFHELIEAVFGKDKYIVVNPNHLKELGLPGGFEGHFKLNY